MPNLRPTMPCFGDDDMKPMFVTSLSGGVPKDVPAAHPLCGTTNSSRATVAGLAEPSGLV